MSHVTHERVMSYMMIKDLTLEDVSENCDTHYIPPPLSLFLSFSLVSSLFLPPPIHTTEHVGSEREGLPPSLSLRFSRFFSLAPTPRRLFLSLNLMFEERERERVSQKSDTHSMLALSLCLSVAPPLPSLSLST